MNYIQAAIHSLQGKMDTVTIIEHRDNNHVIAKYHGGFYYAIYNPFSGTYYVDDLYGKINN